MFQTFYGGGAGCVPQVTGTAQVTRSATHLPFHIAKKPSLPKDEYIILLLFFICSNHTELFSIPKAGMAGSVNAGMTFP